MARQVVLEAAQPDRGDEPAGALTALRLGDAFHLEAEGDVVDDAAPREQVEVLPHHHGVAAERAVDRGRGRIDDADGAGCRGLYAADDLRQRAFAASARTEDA